MIWFAEYLRGYYFIMAMRDLKVKEVFVCLTAILLFAFPTFAQENSGKVLQELQKKEITPKKIPKTPVIEKKKERKKEVIGGKRIFIRKIEVKGAAHLDKQTLNNILSRYEGKKLTIGEINQIAKDITEAYRKKHYILAYAYLPPQEIKNGILEIKVLEGKIGKITVKGNRSYSKKFIQKHLERIRKDALLKEESLERVLLLLNEYPSLSVKSVLTKGKSLGVTDIIAETKDKRPVSGSISYDNFGDKVTSKSRLTAEFDIGNLITSGDYLMLTGITGLDRIDFNRLSYGRAEYLFPIGYNGTKMGLSYAYSKYKAGKQYAPLDIYGDANIAGIYITHPLIKKRNQSLDMKFGFDYKDIYDYMLSSKRSEDNIRVFNLGLTYDFLDHFYGRNIINLTLHQGARDIFGGNGKNDSDTSRLNADGGFTKWTADITRIQYITRYNSLYLRASGQYSNDNLFTAEQFMLGGIGTVRGFDLSSESGDSGYFTSAEFHLSPICPEKEMFGQKLGDTVKFILFADHGWVHRNNTQPGEDKNSYLTSIGAGLRLYAGKHFFVRYDYAVPRIDGNFNCTNAKNYLQVVFNF